MKIVNMHEAKTHLSRLVDAAVDGEEVVIAKSGKPVARLIGFQDAPRPRKPGALRGRIRIADDFDAPLPPDVADGFGIPD